MKARIDAISSVATSASFVARMRKRVELVARVGRALICAGSDSATRGEYLARMLEYEEFNRFTACIAGPHTVTHKGQAATESFPVFVTTNRGVFLLDRAGWHCLLPVTCFGIARNGDSLFLGASAGIHSFVLSAQFSDSYNQLALRDVKILSRYETRYHNERIHQIAYEPRANQLICANCRRNSLLIVDPEGAGIIDEKFLVSDETGFPIYTDQNHLNSVAPHGNHVLFTLHSAGDNGGALGFVADDRVRAYRYAARGVHDVVIHDDSIMFTDSFRAGKADTDPNASGAIRFRGNDYMASATEAIPQKLVLRGLATREDVLMVGYSASAPREQRFMADSGGVLVLTLDGACTKIDGPFSQVYDVLPLDGIRTDKAGDLRSAEELDVMFRRDVGPLLYERPVIRGVKLSKLR
jgi:hypothetical protein